MQVWQYRGENLWMWKWFNHDGFVVTICFSGSALELYVRALSVLEQKVKNYNQLLRSSNI